MMPTCPVPRSVIGGGFFLICPCVCGVSDALLVLWCGEAWDLEPGLARLAQQGMAPDLVVQPYHVKEEDDSTADLQASGMAAMMHALS